MALLAAALVVQNNGMVRVEGTDAAPRRALLDKLGELRAAGARIPSRPQLLPEYPHARHGARVLPDLRDEATRRAGGGLRERAASSAPSCARRA